MIALIISSIWVLRSYNERTLHVRYNSDLCHRGFSAPVVCCCLPLMEMHAAPQKGDAEVAINLYSSTSRERQGRSGRQCNLQFCTGSVRTFIANERRAVCDRHIEAVLKRDSVETSKQASETGSTKVQGSRFKVQGSRFKVQGSRFKVIQGSTLNGVYLHVSIDSLTQLGPTAFCFEVTDHICKQGL